MQGTIAQVQLSNVEDILVEQRKTQIFRSKLDNNELEPFPDQNPITHEDHMFLMERWSVFRMIPKGQLIYKLLEEEKLEEYLETFEFPGKQNYKNVYKIKIGSLINYYQTLPKEMRENPNVKNVYRGLEFFSPTLTLQQKQKALNFACQQSLPLNPQLLVTEDVCEEQVIDGRMYPSRFDEMKLIQNVQSDIIDPHFNPNALDAYLLERSQKEKDFHGEGDWQRPDTQEKSEDLDVFPIDYYDNDDGFWDEYIKEKYENYANMVPIKAQRQYFKH